MCADSERLIPTSHKVVHSNHISISRHQEDIPVGDFHIGDVEVTPKGHSVSKVMTHDALLLGNGEHFCL